MTKSELEHIWYSVTSALENEFRARGWLPPQAARIEVLEAALREIKELANSDDGISPREAFDIAEAALAEGQDK